MVKTSFETPAGPFLDSADDLLMRSIGQLLPVAAFLLLIAPAGADEPAAYSNPIIDAIGPADPAVIRVGKTYYLFPTWRSSVGYEVFTSKDLVHWQNRGYCFKDERGGVWAPDVFHDRENDRFYLYYTVNKLGGGKQIGVAVASDALGPFKDLGNLIDGAIDAHLFKDDDGKLYLYYADLVGGFKIRVQRMKNFTTLTGNNPVVIRPTADWEHARGRVTEGPWLLKRDGTYYLMYSGSGASGPEYAIGYATSKSPMGPFRKYEGNPIARQGGGVFGPGHHCVIEGPKGDLWMVYHQQNSEQVSWNRFLAIDPLWFDDEGVIHTRTTRGEEYPAP